MKEHSRNQGTEINEKTHKVLTVIFTRISEMALNSYSFILFTSPTTRNSLC